MAANHPSIQCLAPDANDANTSIRSTFFAFFFSFQFCVSLLFQYNKMMTTCVCILLLWLLRTHTQTVDFIYFDSVLTSGLIIHITYSYGTECFAFFFAQAFCFVFEVKYFLFWICVCVLLPSSNCMHCYGTAFVKYKLNINSFRWISIAAISIDRFSIHPFTLLFGLNFENCPASFAYFINSIQF